MSNVYRIAWNVTTSTWAVASGTALAYGKGSFCVTLSGIAAAVSLGIPFSRIAQAAPSASYMVASGSVGDAGAASSASGHRLIIPHGEGLAGQRGDALASHRDASTPEDFWRIASARPVAEPDDRLVVVERRARRRSHAQEASESVANVAEAAELDKRTTPHQSEGATSEPSSDHTSRQSEEARYDSTDGAMSARFYNVTRRPAALSVGAGDWMQYTGRMIPASMTGATTRYFDTASPTRRGRVDETIAGSSATDRARPSPSNPVRTTGWTGPRAAAAMPVSMSARAPRVAIQEALADTQTPSSSNEPDNATAQANEPDKPAAPTFESDAAANPPLDPAAAQSFDDGTKIASIRFDGNTVFSAEVLQREMQLSGTNWTSWYTKDNVYTKDRLATALEALRRYYLDHGYLEFRTGSVQTTAAPDGNGVSLAIPLHEGPQYTLSAVRLAGSPPELEMALGALVQNRAGQPLSIGQLLATRFAMLDRLGADGYVQATVKPQLKPAPADRTIDLTLQIDPGRRVAVRRIEITGNTLTRDEVVRREMRLLEGDWYDATKIAQSRKRLNRLGYFSSVDVKTVPAKGAADQVDIQVKVAEKPGAPVSLGAGFSSTERFVASAGIAYDNLLGTGQSIGADFRTGKSFRAVTVSQSNPYFTAGGVRRTTRAYYRANQPLYYSGDSHFKIETTGIDLRFTIPAGDIDQIHVGTAFEHHRLTPDGNTPPAWRDHIAKHGRESGNVPVTLGWSRGRLDNAASPQRGHFAQAAVEYGTPAAGNQYYKADVNAQWYYPFAPGVVLGASVQGGYGNGVGNHAYPIFKHYYAGGIGSVRGYEPGSLSPRDAKTNQPIGGSRMLTGSVELKVPLRGLGLDSRLSAFTFVDGGNAWGASGSSIGSNGMRFSYGTGLAWGSPIGSFKVSVGLPVKRRDSDRYQIVQMEFRAEL